MKIVSARFVSSSTRVSQKPSERLPEFAFIGRSNVGKSSLINMLCSNSKLAKTSQTPGKTKLVNHFIINDKWYLVDLPGYGFAKMPEKDREELSRVIMDYIHNSEDLAVLFVLLGLGENGIPFAIIFTKGDKKGPQALASQVEKNCQRLLEDWEELPPVFVSSSETGAGREEILGYIGNILNSLK